MAIGIESIVRPHVAYYRDALWAIPWAFMYLTFLQLHRLQRSRHRRGGDRIFKLLTVGMVLTALGGVGVFLEIDGPPSSASRSARCSGWFSCSSSACRP